MTAGRTDSFRRHQHPRPNNHAFIDRIAQRNIDKLATANETAAQVAHGRKARFDGRTRVRSRLDRLLRDIQIELIQPPFIEIT